MVQQLKIIYGKYYIHIINFIVDAIKELKIAQKIIKSHNANNTIYNGYKIQIV